MYYSLFENMYIIKDIYNVLQIRCIILWHIHSTVLKSTYFFHFLLHFYLKLKYGMNVESILLSEISQSQKVGFHLYEFPRVIKFMETGSRVVVVRSWGAELKVCINRYRDLIFQDE